MPYPTNDDPDLNKTTRRRRSKPGIGHLDAHAHQTARNEAPQRTDAEDRRLVTQGERQRTSDHGPEGGAGEPGKAVDTTVSDGEIAERAHQIWESEGRPEGKDREHWGRAEEELKRRDRG